MKQISNIFHIFFCFWIVACNSAPQSSKVQKDATITVNLHDKKDVSFYDFFSKLELIPLETLSTSALSYPLKKLIVHDSAYYILDSRQECLFVFSQNGKYLKKIDKYGNGPGEYTLLYDFNFSRFDAKLQLMSAMGYINEYSPDGESFIRKVSLPDDIRGVNYFFELSPENYIFFSNSRKGYKMFGYSSAQRKIISEYCDIPEFIFYNTPYHHSFSPFYAYGDSVRFVQAYNGDVFSLNKDGSINGRYIWDFGKYNFDIFSLKEESVEYYVNHSRNIGANYATMFLAYGENRNYYLTRFNFRNRFYHLIYDKRDGKLYVFNSFNERNLCFPVFVDDQALYFYASPRELSVAIDPKMLDLTNKKIYDSISPEDNPIIIKYTFK